MNQLTAPVLTMSSRDIAELTGKEHKNVCRVIRDLISDHILDAQIEPLNSMGIVNSTTPNLNPIEYDQNWTHPRMFGGL